MGIYDPPMNYGIPSPYGPRTHNWRGGPLNQGSLFHGPIYTRPVYNPTWVPQTLNGRLGPLGCIDGGGPEYDPVSGHWVQSRGCGGLGADPEKEIAPEQLLGWLLVGVIAVGVFAYTVKAEKAR